MLLTPSAALARDSRISSYSRVCLPGACCCTRSNGRMQAAATYAASELEFWEYKVGSKFSTIYSARLADQL